MPLNEDESPPTCGFAEGIPLSYTFLEDGSVPIFWGDNQKLDKETNIYSRPSGMNEGDILVVPKVVRFLYTYGRDDEIEKNKTAGGGGPQPVTWTLTLVYAAPGPGEPKRFVIYWEATGGYSGSTSYYGYGGVPGGYEMSDYPIGTQIVLVFPASPYGYSPADF